ncbi:hypothetical protein [Polyangium spumosum]|uniref:Uncharacterized protein n=1 Tax=Polyangium spumosum TaxID=889282 RepID=A0A6N7Q5B8_9BACT|nr:hypothetical protein [Polyangium spumosum]MRG97474.1 hypothetical protein [Polyangium spumosum]
MSARQDWEEVYKLFDPEQPAYDSKIRVERNDGPVTQIVKALARPFGTPRVLFTGTVGTGKTTELLRLAEARRDHELVVLLDIERHFSEVVQDPSALEKVSPWEVCFLAGLHLIAEFRRQCAMELPEALVRDFAEAWSRAARGSGTPKAAEVDVGVLTKALLTMASGGVAMATGTPAAAVPVMGKLVADAFAALKLNLPVGRSVRELPDQDPDIQTMLGCVNNLVTEAGRKSRPVLFVIDGIDRIRDIERAKALFVDSQVISKLACPSIVCGPSALRHHPSTAAIRGWSVCVLVNEPVLLQSDPRKPGPGVEFFCELFDRRVDPIQQRSNRRLIPDPLLRRLAYRSGGRARDFVRFVRSVAELAWDADEAVASEKTVDDVLDSMRRQREMGLNVGHIGLLEKIAADPEHRFPHDPLAYELLNYGTLLPYPNESEWFYPHPLLTMHLVKEPGSTPSSAS